MRPERTAARARARQRLARAAEADTRRLAVDQWSVMLVAAGIVVTLIYVLLFAPLLPEVVWTPAAIALCLVVAAAVGRALLGYRPSDPGPEAASVPSGEPSGKPRQWHVYGSIAAAALIPYAMSLKVGFLSDDFMMTEATRMTHSIVHVFAFAPSGILYRPLHVAVWWIGIHLWGGAPAGYHLVNLFLHLVNSLLVFALGRRIIGSVYGAWAASLLFAVHPIHVETIVWASCQVDLQCTMFALLSLLGLEGYLAARSRARGALALAGSLVAFFLALLTKESALSLPGVAVLRVFLRARGPSTSRLAAAKPPLLVAAAYGASLSVYLGIRFATLRGMGGYVARPTFWNTVFPSAPLRQIASFFLPLHQPLALATGGPWLAMVAVALMAAGLLWWIAGLPRVRGSHLWLYLGYVFVLAIPVWLLPVTGGELEYSRYAYLPTVGLVLLFGELAATRPGRQGRAGGPVVATICVCAVLSLWYLSPWLGAARIVRRVLAAGSKAVEALPASTTKPVVYIENLPDTYLGAQVFRNGFPLALPSLLKRPVLLRQVGPGSAYKIPAPVLALSTLYPGEYAIAWEEKARKFRLVRSGAQAGGL
jgi:hypothetical protein